MHGKTPTAVGQRLRKIIGIGQGSFPFIYLGCPIFYGRKKKTYFEGLIKKILGRLMTWKNKLLSYGGRYILIAYVLQSMPIYLMFAINPLKRVIEQIHKIFAKFFWGNIGGTKGKHWVA